MAEPTGAEREREYEAALDRARRDEQQEAEENDAQQAAQPSPAEQESPEASQRGEEEAVPPSQYEQRLNILKEAARARSVTQQAEGAIETARTAAGIARFLWIAGSALVTFLAATWEIWLVLGILLLGAWILVSKCVNIADALPGIDETFCKNILNAIF